MRIFISYAREDQAWAQRLCKDLKQAGYRPWLDAEALLPGERWKEAIRKAIFDSHCFVAILSSRSISKRGYVQKELLQALDVLDELPRNEIFVIPARIDDCRPVDETLQELNWVDFFPSYEEGLSRLVSAVKVIAGRQAPAGAYSSSFEPDTSRREANLPSGPSPVENVKFVQRQTERDKVGYRKHWEQVLETSHREIIAIDNQIEHELARISHQVVDRRDFLPAGGL